MHMQDFQHRMQCTACLYDTGSRQNAFDISRIIGQGVSQEIKSLQALAHSQVQQTDCGQYFCIVWAEQQRFQANFHCSLVICLQRIDLAQLQKGAVVLLY